MNLLKKTFLNIKLFITVLYLKIYTQFKQKNNTTKSLLIVKVDAIGDYVIFRNLIEAIRKSDKYKNYKITLLGNQLWKEIATSLDSEYIDGFIWVDLAEYNNNKYRESFFKSVSSKTFTEAINFHFSRSVFTEMLFFAINATEKKGVSSNCSHLPKVIEKISNNLYSKLYTVPQNIVHEFYRLRFLAHLITNTEITEIPAKPVITLNAATDACSIFNINSSFILINCGAGDARRQLPLKKMIYTVNLLLQENIPIYLTGTKSDIAYADEILKALPNNKSSLHNIAGQTSLLQLLNLVNKASYVVCNESSVYHMCIALNKPVLCFSGGGHFNRFANYGTIKGSLLFHKMECYNCNWNCKYQIKPGGAFPCIEQIEATNIAESVNSLYHKNTP